MYYDGPSGLTEALVQTQQSNIVICPSCGAENIEGVDTCENCLNDLRSLDVPDTYQVGSESDLAQLLGDVRLSRAQTVSPGASVADVIAVLRREPSGAVVIVEGDRVMGIFTDRDVLKRVAGNTQALSEPISKFMTTDPVLLRDTDTMAAALNKMGDGGFRHIPMLSDGKLAGVVTGRDVMQWLLGRYFDQSST